MVGGGEEVHVCARAREGKSNLGKPESEGKQKLFRQIARVRGQGKHQI